MAESNIVSTTVNVGGVRLTLDGFGVPAIIGPHTEFSDLYRQYSGSASAVLADLVADGFDTTHPVYKAALAIYSQTNDPEALIVARQTVDTVEIDVDTAADVGDVLTLAMSGVTSGNVYKVYIHDGSSAYSASATAVDASTPATVAAALVTAINATAVAVTAASSGTTGLTLTADVANTPFKVLFVRYESDGTTLDEGDELSVTGGYYISVSGQVAACTSANTSTTTNIATLLAAAVELAQLDADATSGTNRVTLVANAADTRYAVKCDARCSKEKANTLARGSLATEEPTSTLTELITDLVDEGVDFYGVISLDANTTEVLEVAAAVEAQTLIYGVSSRAAAIYDSGDDTDLLSQLAALGYDRTFLHYDASNDTFPEAAVFGENLPTTPGARTWKGKSLSGVSASTLTGGQETAVLDKSGNVYTTAYGAGFWTEGQMVSGRFIDITRDIDYMRQAFNAEIVTLLLASEKIPFTQAGLDLIGNALRAVCRRVNRMGITGPLLDSTTGELYRVTVPDLADISTTDRNNRHATGFVVELQMAGAVHKVFITVNANI